MSLKDHHKQRHSRHSRHSRRQRWPAAEMVVDVVVARPKKHRELIRAEVAREKKRRALNRAADGTRRLNMVVDIEQSLHNQVAHEDQRDAACVKLAEVHLFSPGRVLMHWVRGGARRRRWCWRRTTCKDSHGGEQRCTEHEPGPWL